MLFLSLLTTAAVASARVFDAVPAVPEGWSKVSPALGTDKLSLKIGLKQQYVQALEQAVLAISTPGNPHYGKHMSRDEVRSFVAPSSLSVNEVTAWLASYDITHTVDNDWITIATNVTTANKLLDANFAWYEYQGGGGKKLRTMSYSVPDSVADHVDMIQPTTRFGKLGAQRSTIFESTILDDTAAEAVKGFAATASTDAAPCTTTVTPSCLKALYNINYTAPADGNLVAFASYLEEYARYDDLQSFEQAQVPDAVGQSFAATLINGGLDDQNSSSDSGMSRI